MLDKYINSIKGSEELDIDGRFKKVYRFCGDGNGDFEEISNEARTEIVLNYIDYCEEQILIAKNYLNENNVRRSIS